MDETKFTPAAWGYRLIELLLRPELTDSQVMKAFPELQHYPQPIREFVWNEVKLAGYLARQSDQIKEVRELEAQLIPEDIGFELIPKLSDAGRNVLEIVTPRSLGQALRIPNLSDADRMALLLFLKSTKSLQTSTPAIKKINLID